MKIWLFFHKPRQKLRRISRPRPASIWPHIGQNGPIADQSRSHRCLLIACRSLPILITKRRFDGLFWSKSHTTPTSSSHIRPQSASLIAGLPHSTLARWHWPRPRARPTKMKLLTLLAMQTVPILIERTAMFALGEVPVEVEATAVPGETVDQVWARRDAMEAEAAALVGQMLFAFSRIDMNLGLCLAWVGGGTRLEARSNEVAALGIRERLDALMEHVLVNLPADSKSQISYKRWIRRTHAARIMRNQMVHGRWHVDALRQKVVNIIGLPSGKQQTVEYTLAELSTFNERLHSLVQELATLRKNWPL